jgi:phosphoglycolate phosphatase/pyrophosphatase PpaX
MEDLFEVLVTGDDVIDPKPHPEGVFKALTLLNVQKEDAIFIGDSEADIVAGLQAGVVTIGVQWLEDYQTADFNTQPNQLFKEINDFKQFLQESILQNR